MFQSLGRSRRFRCPAPAKVIQGQVREGRRRKRGLSCFSSRFVDDDSVSARGTHEGWRYAVRSPALGIRIVRSLPVAALIFVTHESRRYVPRIAPAASSRPPSPHPRTLPDPPYSVGSCDPRSARLTPRNGGEGREVGNRRFTQRSAIAQRTAVGLELVADRGKFRGPSFGVPVQYGGDAVNDPREDRLSAVGRRR